MTGHTDAEHKTHCSVYLSDFDTSGNEYGYHDIRRVIDRIISDLKFDKNCERNLKIRERKF